MSALESWNLAASVAAAVLAGAGFAYIVRRDRRLGRPALAVQATLVGDGREVACILQILQSHNADWALVSIAPSRPSKARVKLDGGGGAQRAAIVRPALPIDAHASRAGLRSFGIFADKPLADGLPIAIRCELQNRRGKRIAVQAHGICSSPAS